MLDLLGCELITRFLTLGVGAKGNAMHLAFKQLLEAGVQIQLSRTTIILPN